MRVGRSVEAAQADQQRARNSTGLGQIPNAAPRQGLGPLGERRTRVLILRADCQRTVTRGSCARSADITAFTQRFRRIQLLGARVPAPLCSRHVWPCPSLLRCQRDQTRLLDPAGSADTNIKPSWNVAPTDLLPAVRCDARAGERTLDVMR
jgi:hypothetical protein